MTRVGTALWRVLRLHQWILSWQWSTTRGHRSRTSSWEYNQCVCVCVCMCAVCVCLCMWLMIHVCMCVYVGMCMCVYVCVWVCAYIYSRFRLVFTSFLCQSLPPSSPLLSLCSRLQTATVSESSHNEPTVDSDELTDEVWRTLCGSSDSCMCSMCVYISYNK